MEEYKIHDALLDAFASIKILDQYINKTEPWILAKEENGKELLRVLQTLVYGIAEVADLFRPVLPEKIRRADEYRKQIQRGSKTPAQGWSASGRDEKLALFPRIQ